MLADLRESGSLEQDATVVIFVRPGWSSPSSAQLAVYPENRLGGGVIVNQAVPMRFIVAKNRNGPLATTKEVLFMKDRNTYRTLEGVND